MADKKKTISIVSANIPDVPVKANDRGGAVDAVKKALGFKSEVPADDLASNLSEFLTTMGMIVDGLPTGLGPFELKEMALAIEVSATGKISLLGSGVDISGKSGITLTLKKGS